MFKDYGDFQIFDPKIKKYRENVKIEENHLRILRILYKQYL